MKKEAMVCGDAGMGISSVFSTRVRKFFLLLDIDKG